VRAGQITALQAARQLGISRQRYYQWEKRALRALLSALEDQPKGRPRKVQDPEKHQLQVQVEQLQKQVHVFQQKEKLRQLIKAMEEPRSVRGFSTKKNSK
jgi:transposase